MFLNTANPHSCSSWSCCCSGPTCKCVRCECVTSWLTFCDCFSLLDSRSEMARIKKYSEHRLERSRKGQTVKRWLLQNSHDFTLSSFHLCISQHNCVLLYCSILWLVFDMLSFITSDLIIFTSKPRFFLWGALNNSMVCRAVLHFHIALQQKWIHFASNLHSP